MGSKRDRERGKSERDGREEKRQQAKTKKRLTGRGRLFLSSSASSSPSPSSSPLCIFSLAVDDVDAVEDLVYAHLVESSLCVTPMASSARSGEERESGKRNEKK